MSKVEELKKQMLNGNATAETFEVLIREQGLTMEMIGLISAYYELEDQVKEEKKNFDDALVFKGQREAEENMQEEIDDLKLSMQGVGSEE